MSILKGSLLGMLIFVIIFAIRFHRLFYHALIDPKIISQVTIQSRLFWLGLLGCVLIGCVVVSYWTPTKN